MSKVKFTLTCQSSDDSDDDSSEATIIDEDNCIVETSSEGENIDENCDEVILSATILPTACICVCIWRLNTYLEGLTDKGNMYKLQILNWRCDVDLRAK